MNHYGVDNFSVEEIEHCDKDEADDREKYWISYYQSANKDFGYNMTFGGGGGDTWTNNPHKEITSEKIRSANIGQKRSAEFSERLSKLKKGKYYIEIDTNKLIKLIEEGRSLDEICDEFGISYSTLMYRCRSILDKKIREYRTENFDRRPRTYTEETSRRMAELNRERWLGNKNPRYKAVDTEKLYDMILKHTSAEEMASFFWNIKAYSLCKNRSILWDESEKIKKGN